MPLITLDDLAKLKLFEGSDYIQKIETKFQNVESACIAKMKEEQAQELIQA
jgi:hypothetical protein